MKAHLKGFSVVTYHSNKKCCLKIATCLTASSICQEREPSVKVRKTKILISNTYRKNFISKNKDKITYINSIMVCFCKSCNTQWISWHSNQCYQDRKFISKIEQEKWMSLTSRSPPTIEIVSKIELCVRSKQNQNKIISGSRNRIGPCAT